MKKNLFILVLAIASIAGCKKDSTPAKAAFTTSKSNYYINETVAINNSSTGGKSYSWDFGDGGSSTLQSPTHAYTGPGIYDIKLTVNGSASSTKAVKIYSGTASYEVDNLVNASVPFVSFSVDNSGNLIDLVDNGTIAPGGASDTVFTTDQIIYIGGTLPNDSVFIQVYPTILIPATHNKLLFTDTTSFFTNTSITKQNINRLLLLKATALKKKQIQQFKHIVQ